MKRSIGIALFGILALLLGSISGGVIWCILQIMELGIELVWFWIPEQLGMIDRLLYNVSVCLLGGLLIGLWQRRYGVLPDNMHQVMKRIKCTGGYPYDRFLIIMVAALMPLIFGGAIGPEAGLSGLIAGLCTLVGDRLKYKGDRLAAMAETGFAAALSVIFGAPLFGIIGNLEPDNRNETYRKKLVSKKSRIFIYCMGVIGGIFTIRALNIVAGADGGLPRFSRNYGIGIEQWKWAVPLVAAGLMTALIFILMDRITGYIGYKLRNYKVISCLIAGGILSVLGYYVPLGMFSGEAQMTELMEGWMNFSFGMLLLVACVKMFLVNTCINLGWRGGNIFPMIFSGVAVGYAVALAIKMGCGMELDGSFAVAMVVSAMCGYIMRKPATVVAVLLLCFPVTYMIPIGATAFVTSKIPSIRGKQELSA